LKPPAEQLSRSFDLLDGLGNISKVPELTKRILVTFLLLAVYRIGAHVPTPGIDTAALAAFFEQAKGSLLGLFDMFAGGALSNLSVFALGIMPYISASIILQLLTVAIPYLEKLSKEGESGRRKITQYTRYGTVLLSLIQGFGIAVGLEQMAGPTGTSIVIHTGWGFRLMTVITLTAGTAFIMWLGEQMTEKGIGNGISMIIFAGIVCRGPEAIINTFRLLASGEMGIFFIIILIVMMVLIVGIIVFVESGQRRIPVQYAKRVIGRKMYGGQTTHLPLKVNTAGVIPPIFASSIIMFPATIANFIPHPWMKTVAETMIPGRLFYEMLYVAFIIFFAYFYTAVTFNPVDMADNMKKYGGYVPGIRPGKKTADYIDDVMTKLTFWGALYVSVICVLPSILISYFNVPFYFGGTALLIVVGVALDTAGQIETHLLTRQYEGFMKKGRIARRR
jgi:preprotein translocase subunit SecY